MYDSMVTGKRRPLSVHCFDVSMITLLAGNYTSTHLVMERPLAEKKATSNIYNTNAYS